MFQVLGNLQHLSLNKNLLISIILLVILIIITASPNGSVIFLLIMAITGDVSTVSALASSLPTLIAETYYSREFEREADRYCYEHLVANGIPPIHFANILDRISGLEQPIGFLSTHPSEQERKTLFSN